MTFTGAGSVAKLAQYGMHFDDLNRIRVLDEDTANQVLASRFLLQNKTFYKLTILSGRRVEANVQRIHFQCKWIQQNCRLIYWNIWCCFKGSWEGEDLGHRSQKSIAHSIEAKRDTASTTHSFGNFYFKESSHYYSFNLEKSKLKLYLFDQLREKQLEYDRLASELASLKKMEITQQEFIEQFALQK